MTDADGKTLTEYLGDEWYPHTYTDPSGLNWKVKGNNRTFSTPDDLHAVYSRMVEKGDWEKFEGWALLQKTGQKWEILSSFYRWLFCLNTQDQIPERMAMAAEWVRTHDRP